MQEGSSITFMLKIKQKLCITFDRNLYFLECEIVGLFEARDITARLTLCPVYANLFL